MGATTVAPSYAVACPEALNQDFRKLHSTKHINICDLNKDGGPIVIINTASKCGFTPQFKALEALHQKYKDRGLTVVGVPSNSFNQEEKAEADTASVCYINYGVTFTMLETMPVKGPEASKAFQFLAQKSDEPKWNFNKYLVIGEQVSQFASGVNPLDSELEKAIADALASKPL